MREKKSEICISAYVYIEASVIFAIFISNRLCGSLLRSPIDVFPLLTQVDYTYVRLSHAISGYAGACVCGRERERLID